MRVVFGLSLPPSWWNGHATTDQTLLRASRRVAIDVLMLEREHP